MMLSFLICQIRKLERTVDVVAEDCSARGSGITRVRRVSHPGSSGREGANVPACPCVPTEPVPPGARGSGAVCDPRVTAYSNWIGRRA
jgi:hypothetical protein